jgi:hypothetical protein
MYRLNLVLCVNKLYVFPSYLHIPQSAMDEVKDDANVYSMALQRVAFYTTIPSFILQLTLVLLAVYTLFAQRRNSNSVNRANSAGFRTEKDHELGGMSGRQDSWGSEGKERGSPELEVEGRERVVVGKQ